MRSIGISHIQTNTNDEVVLKFRVKRHCSNGACRSRRALPLEGPAQPPVFHSSIKPIFITQTSPQSLPPPAVSGFFSPNPLRRNAISSNGNSIFHWGLPMFEWGLPMFEWGLPMFEWGSPMFEWGSPMFGWGSPMFRWGLPIFDWGSPMFEWGSNRPMRYSQERKQARLDGALFSPNAADPAG